MMSDEFKLRPLGGDDIDDQYVAWYTNGDGHLDFFTGSGRKFSREILIEDFTKGRESGKWSYYLVVDENDQKIGNVKIGPIDTKNKTSDLVCLIGDRSYLGRGLATKVIKQANKIAFDKFDIRRLQGGMYSSNIASIKAYTRADWIVEATLEGYYLVNGKAEDRICVACFNPKYFT